MIGCHRRPIKKLIYRKKPSNLKSLDSLQGDLFDEIDVQVVAKSKIVREPLVQTLN